MSKKKKQETPYSDKSEVKFIKGTPEDIFPALVETCCGAVMKHIMPALEKTFDDQNAHIQKLIEESLGRAYKMILQHSVEEQAEALKGIEKTVEKVVEGIEKTVEEVADESVDTILEVVEDLIAKKEVDDE